MVHKSEAWKLQCTHDGATVKIEVNGTKRGILGEVEIMELCPKAKEEFQASCKARIVPYSQLYGGGRLQPPSAASTHMTCLTANT